MEKHLKIGFLSIITFLFGVMGLLIAGLTIPELSSFPAIIGNVGVGLSIWYLIDRFILVDINTNEILKEGNNFAAFIIFIALIIMASIIAS